MKQLASARSQILSELEAGWHSANIIEGSETRQITVEVPVATLNQWASRLEAFGSIAVIDEYVVRTLDIRGGGLVTINCWQSGSLCQCACSFQFEIY